MTTIRTTLLALAASATFGHAAEFLFPLGRQTYYAGEAIPLAVADLPNGASANLVFTSTVGKPVSVALAGTGKTLSASLPAGALAPGSYHITLDGREAGKLSVIAGVSTSTMKVAQTSVPSPEGGGNFILANAFGFGLADEEGQPMRQVRGQASGGIAANESMMASGLPAVCYMYWTGFVTHKPFGTEKSWANADMQEAMRFFNFSVGQRLRRFAPLWRAVGPIDEPGLAWGRTPAGGMASGFPNWDEQAWYESRGIPFTADIANYSDEEWMKYIRVRCGILRESYAQASKDIKSLWPDVHFNGDLYALHAIMDGTDGLNQEVNDTPTSHVFFDFFGGPMAVPGQFYLEKCHAPETKLAHAMNGQLVGVPGPQRPLYHWLMGAMLQGGLHDNWWLNTGVMSREDLAAVNEPAARVGPLFQEMAPTDHDIAILWGFTELAMRQKDVAKLESTARKGEQPKLMLPMPEETGDKSAEVATNAYEVGGVYANPVLGLHQSLRRAGYPAHIVHEAVFPERANRYKVLFLVGQNVPLPKEVAAAVQKFIAGEGVVLIDKSSKVKIEGARVLDLDLGADAWRARVVRDERADKSAANPREGSVFLSNLHKNEPMRRDVPAVLAALKETKARRWLATDSTDLSFERHVGGEGALLMVLNGREEFPEGWPAENRYPTYNPAGTTASYTLQGLSEGSAVWCLEGLDWKTVTRVTDPAKPIRGDFAAGEMKLYLAAPRQPEKTILQAEKAGGYLRVNAAFEDLKSPWPFVLVISGPAGNELFRVHRSMNAEGKYTEEFPLGANAIDGDYLVRWESPIGGLTAEKKLAVASSPQTPVLDPASVEILDRDLVRSFLQAAQPVVIAVGDPILLPAAQRLEKALRERGVKVEVKPEENLLRKVSYPRIFNPFATTYRVGGTPKQPSEPVQKSATIDLANPGELRQPGTLTTIGAEGWLDWLGQDKETAYEPGVQIFCTAKNELEVLNATGMETKTDETFRKRWSRPWTKLLRYNGGFQLPPQLPEAYTTDTRLIVLGDSDSSQIARILQASEILPRVVDRKYPGPGRGIVQFAASPFALDKDVLFIGAVDAEGLGAAVDAVAGLPR